MKAVGTHITGVNASSHSCHQLILQDETTIESQLEVRSKCMSSTAAVTEEAVREMSGAS